MNYKTISVALVVLAAGAYASLNAQDGASSTNPRYPDTVIAKTADNGHVGETKGAVVNGIDAAARATLPPQRFQDHLRGKNFGLGGGPTPGVLALDMEPVRDLLRLMPSMRGKTFDGLDGSRFQPFYTTGGMGYIGLGDGARIGGGGMHGERYFTSNTFAGDSIVSMRVIVDYGGFLADRAFNRDQFVFIAGMMVGGGSLSTSFRSGEHDIFTTLDRNTDSMQDRRYSAPFFLFEFHGSLSYSIVSFLHIGVDAALPFFFSAQGFESSTASFTSANPAVRIRMIFGNLG
jgi:hypothetical protein